MILILSALSNALWVTLLFVVVLFASRLCDKPAWIHAMFVLVLAKLLFPPLLWLPLETPFSQTAPETLSTELADDIADASRGVIPADVSHANRIAEASNSAAPMSRQQGKPTSVTRLGAVQQLGSLCWRHRWPTLLMIWLAGSLWALARTIRQLVTLQRATKESLPIPDRVYSQMNLVNEHLGLRRLPSVVVVPIVAPPMVVASIIRTRIVLPLRLIEELDDDELATLLAHELAHLRRRDHWVRLLEICCQTLFWWHPILGPLKERIGREEERACDRWVTHLLPNAKKSYASVLMKTIEFVSRSDEANSPNWATAMADTSDLMDRLRRINAAKPGHRIGWAGRLSAALIALTLLPCGAFVTASVRERNSQTPVMGKHGAVEASGAEQESVKQPDVRLIGFLRLTNDKLVMWKPNGEPVDKPLPRPTELADDQTVAVMKVDPDCRLLGFSSQLVKSLEIDRSSQDPSIAFVRLYHAPKRKFGHVQVTVIRPGKRVFQMPVTASAVGKSVAVNNSGIVELSKLGRVDDRSIRLRVKMKDSFDPDRLVAITQDGKQHLGTSGDWEASADGKHDQVELTFPIPLQRLAGIGVSILQAEPFFFRNAALQPGVEGSGDRQLSLINAAPWEETKLQLPPRGRFTQRLMLEDQMAVDLIAVGRLTGDGLEWWSPGGETRLNVDGIVEADVEGLGTVAVLKTQGHFRYGDPYGLTRFNHYYVDAEHLHLLRLQNDETGSLFGGNEPNTGKVSAYISGRESSAVEQLPRNQDGKSFELRADGVLSLADGPFTSNATDRTKIRVRFDAQRHSNLTFGVTNQADDLMPMSAGGGGGMRQGETTFALYFSLAPEQIKSLVVRRQVVHHFKFSNIAMSPNRKTQVRASASH